jgi:hypothetical protein
MNRILKRPMFRLGGSTSEGITSGLGKPKMQMASADMDMKIKKLTQAYDNYRKQGGTLSFQDFSRLYAEENFNSGGRVGYQTGGISVGGLPGFAISTGLNLLSQSPQGSGLGGLLATAATSAKDPFNRLQAEQAAAGMTKSERDFQTSLFEKEEAGKDRRLAEQLDAQKAIAGMKTDVIPDDILKKYEGNQIKAQREVNFYDNIFKDLQDQYGDQSVSTVTIDSSEIPDKQIERFVKSNPQLARQVVYDVATGRAIRFVRNTQTNKFQIVPADPADIDDTGEDMPDPNKPTAGLFGQKTKPDIVTPAIKELGEEFSEEMYQTP